MKLKELTKTKTEIKEMGYSIENNVIEKMDVNVIAHFNNITTLELFMSNCVVMGTYNMGGIFHIVLKAIVELFDLSEENGLRLSNIKNVPCRIGSHGWGSKVEVIGNFMKDEFIVIQELIDLAVKESNEQCKKQIEKEVL